LGLLQWEDLDFGSHSYFQLISYFEKGGKREGKKGGREGGKERERREGGGRREGKKGTCGDREVHGILGVACVSTGPSTDGGLGSDEIQHVDGDGL
jgi:hypothetical protein